MQIIFNEITGKDLKDTGNRFDAQDPCIVIQVGKSSVETPRYLLVNVFFLTPSRQEDAGTFVKYTDQFILPDITETDLQSGNIVVEVFNKHVTGMKKHVGKGSLPLKNIFPTRNLQTQILIPLLFKNKEKQGTVILSATLVDPNAAPVVAPAAPATPAPSIAAPLLTPAVVGVVAPLTPPAHVSLTEAETKSQSNQPPEASPGTKETVLPVADKEKPMKAAEGNVKPPAEEHTPVAQVPAVSPPSFASAIVHIKSISAKGLPNVELMGENDPFAILAFNNWTYTTRVQDNAGGDVTWEYGPSDSQMQFEVTPESLKGFELSAKVWDKNDLRSNTLIGEGSGSLQAVLQLPFGSDVQVTIPLMKKKKAAGLVTIVCSLEDKDKQTQTQPPAPQSQKEEVNEESKVGREKKKKQEGVAVADADAGANLDVKDSPVAGEGVKDNKSRTAISCLRFKQISVSDLPNVERLGGENDPFVVLKFGDKWTATTTAQEEAGSSATWDYSSDDPQMAFEVTASDLKAWSCAVEVWDKNTKLSNVLIGVGETSLQTALTIPQGDDVRISFPIKNDKKKKSAGSVTLVFTLIEKPPAFSSPLDPQSASSVSANNPALPPEEPFTLGTLFINRIKCSNLINVELLGENDPYVELSLGSWKDKTTVQEDVGAKAVWDNLDMKIEGITSDVIDSELLTITVMDKNSARSDVLIGKGTVSVARARETLRSSPEEVDLIVNLLNKEGKKLGKVIVYVTLRRYKPKSTLLVEVTDKLKLGTLSVTRIRARDIKNVELLNLTKADPYCVLKYHGETIKTAPIDGGGSAVCWDHLDFQFVNITKEILLNESLTFELWDSNSVTPDKLIGKHQLSLRAVGAELGEINFIEFDVADKQGRPAGHIVLDAVLQEGVEVTDDRVDVMLFPIPESFTAGRAFVKQICVFDAKNTELVGSQDLYAVLNYGKWSEMTSPKANQGSSVAWKNLDMAFDVTLESLRSQQLRVSLYDENTLRADVLLGETEVSLLRAVHHFGEEVTLKFSLPPDGKTGKCPGRFTLSLVIQDPLPVAVEIDPSFSSGCIVISKAIVTEMKPTKNQFLKVCFLPNKSAVFTTEESNELVWEFLSIKSPVTHELLSHCEVYVELYSKGMLGQKLLAIGKEEVAFLGGRVGEEQDIRFNLFPPDKEGQGSSAATPLGRITLTAALRNESADAAEQSTLPPKPIPLPDDFIDGMLYVTYVQVFGLKNTELIGKSDPFVKFELDSTLGPNDFQTKTLQGAGGDVIWEDVKLKFKVSYDDILAGKPMRVSVWDENSLRSNVCVGAGNASLRRFASQLKNEVELSVDILDSKGKPSGRVVIRGELKEMEAAVVSQLPESFTGGVLCIKKICVHDMKNIELIGLPDPYVKIRTVALPPGTEQEPSVQWAEKTYTQDNVGCNPVWNYLDFAFPVTLQFLTTEGVEFQVWEENPLVDELIGTGFTDLQAVSQLYSDIEIKIPILDRKKKSAGRMTVTFELRNLQPKEIEVAPEFRAGTLFIRRITAYGLHNTEWFGKGDPYLKLQLLDWKAETQPMTNKGDNIVWDYLDMKRDLTLEQLKSEKISVAAYDKNSLRADALIGSGEVKVIKAGVNLKQETELSLELVDAKGKTSGRVVLFVTLQEGFEPDESTLEIPPTFQFGSLHFQRIKSFDLKNTEIVGLQDPYVILKLGTDWREQTYTKDEGGSDVLWEYLDLRCDVTADMLRSERLEVEVWDENKGLKDKLIGKATTTLIKPGAFLDQEVELHVQLVDEQNKNSGRLVITCTVHNEKEDDADGAVDPSFARGELKMKRITCFNLKNTELIGKQDPYVELLIPDYDYSQKTPVLEEIGSNPVWDHLDYSLVVKSNLVKVGYILVKVWDKNTSSDTLIGSAEIPIRKAGCNLEKDVELRGRIYDTKGVVTGRIVIQALLHALPPEAADSEIILPPDFHSGIVSFNRIQLKGLKNREIIGDQVISLALLLTSPHPPPLISSHSRTHT
jgi:Ca2+-dependent lipid-binding protein